MLPRKVHDEQQDWLYTDAAPLSAQTYFPKPNPISVMSCCLFRAPTKSTAKLLHSQPCVHVYLGIYLCMLLSSSHSFFAFVFVFTTSNVTTLPGFVRDVCGRRDTYLTHQEEVGDIKVQPMLDAIAVASTNLGRAIVTDGKH